jgi:2-iminobutanoate/2-iminopropanoate deaminase
MESRMVQSASSSTGLQIHMVAGSPHPLSPFCHAVESDGRVFVTGQMPDTPAAPGSLPERIAVPIRNVTANLQTVPAGMGPSLPDVMAARIYLTRFAEDCAGMNAVDASCLLPGRRPARTCLGVTGFACGPLVETDLVAWRP